MSTSKAFRFTTLAMATCLALGSVLPVASAEARDRRYHHDRRHYHDRGNNTGSLVAAGIIGLVIGGMIASSNRRNRAYDDGYYDSGYYGDYSNDYYGNGPTVIYEERIYRRGPRAVSLDEINNRRRLNRSTSRGGIEPWSRGWYQYCSRTYRSFDARRGTYRGRDGRNHFCEVR